jgi:hypothetical protein
MLPLRSERFPGVLLGVAWGADEEGSGARVPPMPALATRDRGLFGQHAQNLVAGIMALGIVDLLEEVDIKHKYRKFLNRSKNIPDYVEKFSAIWHTREFVRHRFSLKEIPKTNTIFDIPDDRSKLLLINVR